MSNYHIDMKQPRPIRTIDASTNTVIEDTPPAKQGPAPAIMLALAVLYTISPIDIIPDVPIIGWIDDATILIAALMNYLEKSGSVHSHSANLHGTMMISLLRKGKWIVLILGAIACALILLAGVAIFNVIF